MRHQLRRSAFTMVELMVVIACILIILALLMPAVQKVRESSKRLECSNHLKEIGTACQNHSVIRKTFPDSGDGWWLARSKTPEGVPNVAPDQDWGWAYQILPYIEQLEVWNQANDTDVARAVIKFYFCPSRRAPQALPSVQSGMPDGLRGAIDYAGNGGIGPATFPSDASFYNQTGTIIPRARAGRPERIYPSEIPDGAGNTFLVGERNFNRTYEGQSWMADENNGYINGWDWDTIRWGYSGPAPDRRDGSSADYRFGSSHNGGVMFVLCDGSVRFIKYSISLSTYQSLCHRNDGQKLGADAW